MSRYVAFLIALTSASLVVPAADAKAPARVGVDQATQVSFSVSGRELAVRLRPIDGATNPLAADLSGSDVVLACRGRSPRDGADRIASSKAVWPAGATEFTTRLSKDVSGKLRWCIMERPDGSDLAVTLKLRIPNTAAQPKG